MSAVCIPDCVLTAPHRGPCQLTPGVPGRICSNPGCSLHWTHAGACLPGEMCGTPGCTLPMAHLGICRVQRIWKREPLCTTPGCALLTRHEVCITPRPDGARVSLHPELEFTPWARILTAPVAAAVLLATLGLVCLMLGEFRF